MLEVQGILAPLVWRWSGSALSSVAWRLGRVPVLAVIAELGPCCLLCWCSATCNALHSLMHVNASLALPTGHAKLELAGSCSALQRGSHPQCASAASRTQLRCSTAPAAHLSRLSLMAAATVATMPEATAV